MRIVIAGGSGFLGQALAAACRRDGDDVRVLTRRARSNADVQWSPDQPSGSWVSVLDGADAVINLAGAPIADGRWTAAAKAAIRTSRVEATTALVRGINVALHPPPVLISGSAIGIYGPRGGEPLTESASLGDDFLAGICKEWEAHAGDVSAATRVVLVRTGLVLSANGGALPRLALPFWFFAGGRVGSGEQYMSWIHIDDWVALVRWAIAQPVSGPFNATAPEPVANAQFAQTLGRVLHRPAILPTPALPLRLALGELADAAILSGQRVVPAKAEAEGFRFQYRELESALRAVYERT